MGMAAAVLGRVGHKLTPMQIGSALDLLSQQEDLARVIVDGQFADAIKNEEPKLFDTIANTVCDLVMDAHRKRGG